VAQRLQATIQQTKADFEAAAESLSLLRPYVSGLKPKDRALPSFTALINVLDLLGKLHAEIMRAPFSVTSVSQATLRIDRLGPALRTLNDEFPTKGIFDSLKKPLKDAHNAPINLFFVFGPPLRIAEAWKRFWSETWRQTRPEDGERRSYQQCVVQFTIRDEEKRFREKAEEFAKELGVLYKAAEKNPQLRREEHPRLHDCLPGKLISGTIEAPAESPANLFVFQDKVVLFREGDKWIWSELLLNVWIVESIMFARAEGRVYDILGTSASFAFKPKDGSKLLTLWSSISPGEPHDFGIFKPVMLSDRDPANVPELSWVEIGEV
jgi:hypothetical protein